MVVIIMISITSINQTQRFSFFVAIKTQFLNNNRECDLSASVTSAFSSGNFVIVVLFKLMHFAKTHQQDEVFLLLNSSDA